MNRMNGARLATVALLVSAMAFGSMPAIADETVGPVDEPVAEELAVIEEGDETAVDAGVTDEVVEEVVTDDEVPDEEAVDAAIEEDDPAGVDVIVEESADELVGTDSAEDMEPAPLGTSLDESGDEEPLSATNGHTRAEAVQWARDRANERWEINDGTNQTQCTELIWKYYEYLGYSHVEGHAYHYLGDSYGAKKPGWTRPSTSSVQPGDIVIWDQWAPFRADRTDYATNYGHIGIVISVDGNTMVTVEANAGEPRGAAGYKYNREVSCISGILRPDWPEDSAKPVPVYRLYNRRTSEHLYTTNRKEYESLPRKSHGDWVWEGVAWYAPDRSKTPVYRMYNTRSGDHHYTTSKKEYRSCGSGNYRDWRKEGIAFYSDTSKRLAIYRLYNWRLWRGQHHYTTSKPEQKLLIGQGVWVSEGIGFYAMLGGHAEDLSRYRFASSDYYGGKYIMPEDMSVSDRNMLAYMLFRLEARGYLNPSSQYVFVSRNDSKTLTVLVFGNTAPTSWCPSYTMTKRTVQIKRTYRASYQYAGESTTEIIEG